MSEEKKCVGPSKRSPELAAMAAIEKSLESLTLSERDRVLSWAKSKFACGGGILVPVPNEPRECLAS